MTSMYGPVDDWATDLDHAEPEYNERAHEIWDDFRDRGCPVAHTERYGGMWAPLTHALVKEVAYDTDHFTQPRRRGQYRSPDRRGAGGAGAADHQRPAVPSDRPPVAAATVLAEGDRSVGARGATPVQRAARPDGWGRTWRVDRRCRRAVRAAHPGQRDLAHARLPARGRRLLPRVRPPRARTGQPARR